MQVSLPWNQKFYIMNSLFQKYIILLLEKQNNNLGNNIVLCSYYCNLHIYFLSWSLFHSLYVADISPQSPTITCVSSSLPLVSLELSTFKKKKIVTQENKFQKEFQVYI